MTKFEKILFFLIFFNFIFSEININSTHFVNGCTDIAACNYDINANIDDGSCLYEYGCTDQSAFNYNSNVCEDLSLCEYSPVLNIDDQSVLEDNHLNIDLSQYASDLDNDISYFSLVSISSSANASINENNMNVTFNEHYNGWIYAQVRVFDSNGFNDTDGFYIQVIAVNDPPEIDAAPYLETTLNEQFTYVLTGNDVDNSMFTFSLFNNEPGMIIEEDFGFESRIVFTPSSEQGWIPGQTFTFSVSVSDGEYTASDSYTITIVPENNNVPPEIVVNNFFQINEDESIEINFQVNDDDSNITASNISVVLDYDQHSSYNPFQYPVLSGNQSSLFQFTANPYDDWNGDITIIIDIDDGLSWSSSNATINVNEINDAPFIENIQNFQTTEGSSINGKIYIYDIDSSQTLNDNPYGFSNMNCIVENLSSSQIIEFQEIDTGTQYYYAGSGGYNANHYFTELDFFTSGQNLDWYGTEEFSIVCEDEEGLTDNKNFNVTFTNVNDAPIISDFNDTPIEVNEDSSISINLSGIDIDDESVNFVVNESSGGSDNISVQINQTGTFVNNSGEAELVITPNQNYNGQDQIEVYLIDQGNLESNKILIDITIHPIDDNPFVTAINKSTNEDSSIDIQLDGSINDSNNLVCNESLSDNGSILCDCNSPALEGSCDIEGEGLTYDYTDPSHGTVTINGSEITYVPDNDYFGDDLFEYSVFDDNGGDGSLNSNTATISITVNAVNDAPLAENQNVETNEDESLTITIIGDDIDPDNLTFDITTPASNGNTVLSRESATVIYTPNSNYNGNDSFTFTVSDGTVTDEGVIAITINPVDDTPVVSDINKTTDEDNLLEIQLDGFINDSNNLVCNGNLSDNGSILCDCSSPALEGSCDIEGEGLTYDYTNPSHGTVTINGSVITYIPDNDYFGDDSFTYTVFDDNDTGDESLYSNTATIFISVNAVNDAPLAENQNVVTDEDESVTITIVGNDIDPDNLTFEITTSPTNGNTVLSRENATVVYTPNPNYNINDSFTFTVSDGTVTDEGTVSITINPIDDTPVTTNINKTVDEDELLEIQLDGSVNDYNNLVCNGNLSDNFSILCDCSSPALEGSCDIEGEGLTYDYTDPSHGTVTINGSVITYIPDNDYFGDDSFTYTVFDDNDTGNGNLYSNTATIFISVAPVNDPPELTNISDQEINEDNIFLYQIVAQDVDDELLAYEIDYTSDYYTVNFDESSKELNVTPLENYNGELDITIIVSDEEFTDSISFKLTVLPINDVPVSYDITAELVEDDCEDVIVLWNNFNDDNLVCNNTFSDNGSILCDCSETYTGSCDIDNENLICYVDENPANGSVYEDNAIAYYNPNDDYYGSDQFTYYCCDLVSCSESSNVTITISDQNDQPLFNNCFDNNSDSICDNTLNLENIDIPEVVLYEDCNEVYAGNNDACSTYQGISIEQIRTGFNDLSDNVCSQSNTWYDYDCIDGGTLDVSYGIAVTSDFYDAGKGVWQYLLNGENEFQDFVFSDSNGFACDYILLDDNDKIRFVPNSNEKSDFGEILSYPSFVFYAWDQTQDNLNGSCVSFNEDDNSPCGIPTIPLSNLSQKAFWEIKSVNDPPVVLINDLENSITGNYESITYDGINGNLIIKEDAINLADSNSLSILLSSDSDNSFFLFSDIDSDLSFTINNNDNSLIDLNLIELPDNFSLNFNTIENMNGVCMVNIGVTDGEFTEAVNLDVEVLQVNDAVNIFEIEDGISNYLNPIENTYINTQTMFETPGFIKYQDYLPDNFPLPDNYTDEDVAQLFSLSGSKPVEPDLLLFQWENNINFIQDIDTNPIYNSDENLYSVFYRLELLNETNNTIHVLKDSINTDLNEYDVDELLAKTSINLKNNFKYYSYDDITQCSNDIEYFSPSKLDVSGEVSYKWRIVAQNYIIKDTDSETDAEIYCTGWSTDDTYYIDLEYPVFDYNFVLNDIYIDYYDLYMVPSEPLNFFNGQKNYIHYHSSNNWNEENVNVEKLNLQNEEIYFSSDIFTESGSVGYTFVAYDYVGNINISHKHITFDIVTPGSYFSYNSPDNLAQVEIINNNFESNVLIHEITSKKYNYISNLVSDVVSIQSNQNLEYIIKFRTELLDQKFGNNLKDLAIVRIDNNDYEILSTAHNADFVFTANQSTHGEYAVVLLNENDNNEIPSEVSLMDCYPNPFNPTLTIYYNLKNEAIVNINIFDLLGNKIINLENNIKKAGEHYSIWNGVDQYGNKISSGIYFVKMNYDNNIITKKITLLK